MIETFLIAWLGIVLAVWVVWVTSHVFTLLAGLTSRIRGGRHAVSTKP